MSWVPKAKGFAIKSGGIKHEGEAIAKDSASRGLNRKASKLTKKVLQGFVDAKNAELNKFAETNNMKGMPIQLTLIPKAPYKIHLTVDKDFYNRVFARKLEFNVWLKEEYGDDSDVFYQLWDEHYKKTKKGSIRSDSKLYRKAMKKFNASVEHGGVEGAKTKKALKKVGERWSIERIAKLGIMKGVTPSMSEGRFDYQGNVEKAVSDWIEKEPMLFSDSLVFGSEGVGYTASQTKDIKNILSNAAKQIHALFTEINFNGGFQNIVEDYLGDDAFKMPQNFDNESFVKAMEGKGLPSKSTPKFPNIDRLRNWYLKHNVLFDSNKLGEFYRSSPKGKINFIDSAIFLIGLNIFEKRGGERSKLRGFNKTARYEDGKKSYANKPSMKRARKGRVNDRSEKRKKFREPFNHGRRDYWKNRENKRGRNT